MRGEETILIAPNSVVGLPAEKKEGLSTTIVQQAGSILLEVEKRNVKHFEVETPYLAAVVKGTQFRVTVNAGSTSVDVIRGQVQVADFRSGQIAQVMPGQHATAFAQGNSGLSLGGSGTFSPIEHGQPRAPSIDRVPVPKSGLTAPRHAANGQPVRALGHGNARDSRRHRRQRIASGAARCSWSFDQAWRDPDFVLAWRGPAEFPPGHPWSCPRSDTGTGATRNVANRDTVWTSRNSTDDGHRKQFQQCERREQQQCRDRRERDSSIGGRYCNSRSGAAWRWQRQ